MPVLVQVFGKPNNWIIRGWRRTSASLRQDFALPVTSTVLQTLKPYSWISHVTPKSTTSNETTSGSTTASSSKNEIYDRQYLVGLGLVGGVGVDWQVLESSDDISYMGPFSIDFF